jgi:hypothetical protein
MSERVFYNELFSRFWGCWRNSLGPNRVSGCSLGQLSGRKIVAIRCIIGVVRVEIFVLEIF